MEMFTGKRPFDDIIRDGLELQGFDQMAFPDRIMEIGDPLFIGNPNNCSKQRGSQV